MPERRFNEAEVAAIFERATRTEPGEQPQLAPGEGMTLAQVTEIGREVGIAPEAIAQAAVALQTAQPVSRTMLGLPIGVARTVELNRTMSDEEWERLVADLRETFDARGVVRSDGSLRQWTNGNLQALLEPSATGQRLRLRTFRDQARILLLGGLTMLGSAGVVAVSTMLAGRMGNPGIVSGLSLLVAGGAAMFGAGALGLPRWARRRAQQMEAVAGRALTQTAPTALPPAGVDSQPGAARP